MHLQDWILEHWFFHKRGLQRYSSSLAITLSLTLTLSLFGTIDSCQVNNGACDVNAVCSHDGSSNAVVCTCKTGYTNTGSAPTVNCTGKTLVALTASFHPKIHLSRLVVDTCLVNNGGCDANAICSHDSASNVVKCYCKIGYTFAGNGSNLVCTGNSIIGSRAPGSRCSIFVDACLVNNGGCDPNATCSHETSTNAVTCTCKTGYTNTGSATNVVCTGLEFESSLLIGIRE